MKRKGPRAPSPQGTSPLVADPVAHTGEVTRDYEIDDRLLRTLFVAVCQSMNLEAYRDSRQPPTWLSVTAPDVATQDRLEVRFTSLAKELDDRLMALTADFIRTHCGLDAPIRPRG